MSNPENPERFPGMPDSSVALMMAAQQQVTELKKEVQAGRRQARMTKIQVRILGVVAVALLVITGVLGASLSNQTDLYNRIHQQQLQSCEFANTQRSADAQVWYSFIDLLTQDNPSKEAKKEGAQFKQFVAQVNAPRNCQEAYSSALELGN